MLRIFTSLTLIVTSIGLGWWAFARVWLDHPGWMLALKGLARDGLAAIGVYDLPAHYHVLVDLMLSDKQVILMGFIVAAVAAIALSLYAARLFTRGILALFSSAFLHHAP